MGWQLTQLAAELPATPTAGGSNEAVVVALIAALGTVISAVLLYAGNARSRTTSSPPIPDPRLGERVAVVETHDRDDRRTLAQLDRHVDGISDRVERHRWELDAHATKIEKLEQAMDQIRQAWRPPS